MTSPPFTHPRIELLATSMLKPSPGNARTHSVKQIGQIGGSIERFGWLVPIIIDEQGMIVAGHGRWLAAKRLKLAQVPVIRAEFLTEDDKKAFMLADNRIAQLSGWDDKLLAAELDALFTNGYNFEVTGFTTADLDFSLPQTKPDEIEQVELPDPEAVAVSQASDLWLIGDHLRLLCGSSLDVASFETLLGDDRARMVFADPPYNVPIQGHVSGLGKTVHREFAQASGEMSPAEFTSFLRTVFRNLVLFSTSGSIHYQCMDWRHMREILDAGDGVYDELKQLIVWNKGSGSMGTYYRSQHELIFAFKAGKGRHINTFGLGENGRYRTNIWSYPGANSFGKGRAQDLADHPTVKPTAMVIDAIRDCSHRGDLILDPFCGSGTTLIAAYKTKRRGAAIEIDPLYVDTALRRLTQASGLVPILAGDGRTFDEIAQARAAGQGG